MNKKNDSYSVYIYNSIEEEWDFISSFSSAQQKKLINASNRFADCYLFANALLPSFTLITPQKVNGEFAEYFEKLSGSRATILTPKIKSPFICENVVADSNVFSQIVTSSIAAGSLSLYAYAITPHIFQLKRALEKAGVKVVLVEAPLEKYLGSVSHFGCKSGFRSEFSQLMPQGSIVKKYTQLEKSAISLFNSSPNGIVIKTDKGNAGQGVYIFRKNKIKTSEHLSHKIKNIINKEPYLKKHALIVEEFIDTSKEKKCPFPSVECFIHQNGKIEIPYYCNMIVTPTGEFYGMEMHESVLKGKIKNDVIRITNTVARKMKSSGYRGRFDIDMMCDGKQVYADEANTRINGGTDTYLLAKKLIGENVFSKRYVLSSYITLTKKQSFLSLHTLLSSFLYDKKTKTGLIINSSSVIENGGFTYVIIEKNKNRADAINHSLSQLLK